MCQELSGIHHLLIHRSSSGSTRHCSQWSGHHQCGMWPKGGHFCLPLLPISVATTWWYSKLSDVFHLRKSCLNPRNDRLLDQSKCKWHDEHCSNTNSDWMRKCIGLFMDLATVVNIAVEILFREQQVVQKVLLILNSWISGGIFSNWKPAGMT